MLATILHTESEGESTDRKWREYVSWMSRSSRWEYFPWGITIYPQLTHWVWVFANLSSLLLPSQQIPISPSNTPNVANFSFLGLLNQECMYYSWKKKKKVETLTARQTVRHTSLSLYTPWSLHLENIVVGGAIQEPPVLQWSYPCMKGDKEEIGYHLPVICTQVGQYHNFSYCSAFSFISCRL